MQTESPIPRLTKEAAQRGWKFEPTRIEKSPNPNALSLGGDSVYPTLISPDGVKIALSSTDIYSHNGRVMLVEPFNTDKIRIAAIISPEESRRKGLASTALKALQEIADTLCIVFVGEPVQMKQFKGKKSLTTRQLIAWYKRLGWTQRNEGDDSILEYLPR